MQQLTYDGSSNETFDVDVLLEPLNFELPSLHTGVDIKAFEKLFRSHKSKLNAFVRKHIRQSNAVEDVVQQTFLEAYRCWHNFRGDSKPETWLYGIALNVVRNNLTRLPEYKYQFEDADELGDDLHEDFADDPFNIALRVELVNRIKKAIEKLPKSMVRVVQLIVIDGCSYEDVAHELQIPVGTVRSRLARARFSLREIAQ